MWLGPCDSGFGVLSQKLFFFFGVVYLFTTTFDPTNNSGKFIYTQLHSSRFPQMFFFLLLLLIKSCVVPNDYMTFKVTEIVFFWRSFNSIWSLVFTTKTQHVMTTEVCVTSSFVWNTVVCGLISRPLDFIIGAVYIFHIFPSQSGAVTMYLAAK